MYFARYFCLLFTWNRWPIINNCFVISVYLPYSLVVCSLSESALVLLLHHSIIFVFPVSCLQNMIIQSYVNKFYMWVVGFGMDKKFCLVIQRILKSLFWHTFQLRLRSIEVGRAHGSNWSVIWVEECDYWPSQVSFFPDSL